MKFDNQLRYAVTVINDYRGEMPLSQWLNGFFREHKQMGSRDRKTLSEMVYGYYRLGQMEFASVEERIIAALSISDTAPEIVSHFGKPEFSIEPSRIFPSQNLLSEGIDFQSFALSFLQQPNLFLRIRPGKHSKIFQKLKDANIPFELVTADCLSLNNRTKISEVLDLNKDVVVQDISSQNTGRFINDLQATTIWDSCAASGGKSIMAFDRLDQPQLIVSDLRSGILEKLHERFAAAGIRQYSSFVSDLTKPAARVPEKPVDLIIADVPCSGSGTWARTPEQLYFFAEQRLSHYADLQRKILSTILQYNQHHAPILYITCSVFRKENEDMVHWVVENSAMKLREMELIKGYEDRADTMFAALFTA